MPYPNPLSPSGALAVFRAELTRAAVSPEQAAVAPALWPRFAGYYQGLARLPRKARRALQRRWRRSLGGLALLLALGQAPALAATIAVDGTSCTLVDAITAANNDQPTGGCNGGSGADTITLPANSIHTLTSVNNTYIGRPVGLPVINSAITTEGNGSTIARDPAAPEFRILHVAQRGNLTLEETTITGGRDFSGAGIQNRGTLTLANSTVSGNFASFGGGVANSGTMVLTSTTVSGNSADNGGSGVENTGTLTLIKSTVSGNSVSVSSDLLSGGVRNSDTVTLINSAVSGNSDSGLVNIEPGFATLTNSTVSGNSRGGVINISGTLTLINSTVSGNSGYGAGVRNEGGVLTLTRTLISGNTAYFFPGREVLNFGTVVADSFNLFGRNGISGVEGFTPGPTDIVPNLALIDILDARLSDNGGPTPTHALVFGSLAVDAAPAPSCATATDQRGVTRPQDDNGDAIADCDIGAFEGAQAPAPPPLVEAEAPNPQIPCKDARCQVLVSCNLSQSSGTLCTNRINLFVRARAARLSDEVSAKAPRRIRFSFGVANVPPGQTKFVKLKLTKQGKDIFKRKKKLRGVMEIRNTPGTAIKSTPVTINIRKRP